MNLTITNLSDEPEAMAAPDGSLAVVLHTQQPYSVTQEGVQVVIIGDKPSARDAFARAADALEDMARKLLTLIAGRKHHAEQRYGKPEDVRVAVANHGSNPVRAILGDGTTERTVSPGATATLGAAGYVELRELGVLPETDPNANPDAP